MCRPPGVPILSRPRSAAVPAPATILVADDVSANRTLFTVYLRGAYAVEAVETAEAAQARIEAGGVDLALLDISYGGGMSGVDLIRRLRADPATAGVRAVALTAHDSPEDRAAYLAAGFDGYLPKPVLKAQMLAAVAEHLR